MRVKKNCGSCGWFVKLKQMRGNSGICEYSDTGTNADKGRDCEDWEGITYKITSKANFSKRINKDFDEN